MSAPAFDELRASWIAKAAELHEQRFFASYTAAQCEEVLRKGYVGQWRPDQALQIALAQVEKGQHLPDPPFTIDMREHFGIVGTEVRKCLMQLLAEAPPQSYKPPKELHDPPGYPFIFQSGVLGKKIYFKIQISGSIKKPRVRVCSCHPPLY